MNKLCLLSIAVLLIGPAAGPALAEENTRTVTLEGKATCAKCTLHTEGQDECRNVLIVDRSGKIRVTGQVRKEGDRRLIENEG